MTTRSLQKKHPPPTSAPPAPPNDNQNNPTKDQPPAPLMIVGGGIVGLVLALALDTQLNNVANGNGGDENKNATNNATLFW